MRNLHLLAQTFSQARNASGTHQFNGLRPPLTAHVQRYLDEFVFRWNRRRHTRIAFDRLLGLGMGLEPATYRDFVDQRA